MSKLRLGSMSRAVGCGLMLAGAFVSGVSAADAAAGSQQNRLLNALDAAALPGIGAWMVDDLSVKIAEGVEPRLGAAALQIAGISKGPGGKVDAPAFDGSLPGCRKLSLWVSPTAVGNVDSVGFQVRDAKGEFLMQTVPLDWQGWKQIEIDPAGGGMRPAYEQKDQDGKVDLPLTSVHVIWFAKAAGPASVVVDALTATSDAQANAGVSLRTLSSDILEPERPLAVSLIAENGTAEAQDVSVRYTLQSNPTYADPVVPDPVYGYDHALGAPSTAAVDGVEKGDAKLCDGDEFSGFETPWGAGFTEVVATIDLKQARNVKAVRWHAGDANWIDKADVSASLDGTTFTPVEGAQGVEMRAKWAGPHSFPWPKATDARYLRFRFHNNGKTSNCIRLPVSIMVYDGIENDTVAVPQVGEMVAEGTVKASVRARDFAELAIRNEEKLGPGAYMLGVESDIAGKKQTRWSNLFVMPADTVPADRARRFGINGADTSEWMADNMRRCGFGFVRFENAKWQMYMPTRDRVAFDGTVAPWNLNYDKIFANYKRAGMQILPYVFQPPEWALDVPKDITKNRAGYPPKDPADYGDAIFQLVARFGRNKVEPSLLKSDDKKSGLGMIDAVELWNEPNLNDPGWGPFVGTMEQYFDVMRAGADGARRADPKLPVSACGLAGIDLEIVGRLADHHYADGKTPLDLVDIVNVHFYSGREEPETVGWDPNVDRNGPAMKGTTYPEQLEDLVEWRDSKKAAAQIWLTETGNDVGGPIGLTERHQAAKIPRAVMLALASGIDKVFIYRESGSDASMHAGAGLLRNDHSIRASWITVGTMIRQLQGFEGKALRLPSDNPAVWMYLWEDGERRVVTAWTTGETMKLPMDLGQANVCDAFGRSTAVGSTEGTTISYFPSYIAVSKPSTAFEELVSKARAQAETRTATRRKLGGMKTQLFDFGTTEHVGMLKGFGLPRRFTPVVKDTLWSEDQGYGWTVAAAGNDDARWIADLLERDACRVGPTNVFRFRLEPGKHTLRVRARSINEQQPTDAIVKVGEVTQKKTVSKTEPVAEFMVEGGKDPVEVSIADWGMIYWITAIPEAQGN